MSKIDQYVHTMDRALRAHARALTYPEGSYQRQRWYDHADALVTSTEALACELPIVHAVPGPDRDPAK